MLFMDSMTRRIFIRGLMNVAAVAVPGLGNSELYPSMNPTRQASSQDEADDFGAAKSPPTLRPSEARQMQSLKSREGCAQQQSLRPLPEHVNNGDEKLLPRRIGNFTKGLPHAQSGEVEPGCYETLLKALDSETPDAFQKVARGSGM